MEKEENLNQEDTSTEPSEENNKPEDQTEKVEKSSSTEEKKEISPEEKIVELGKRDNIGFDQLIFLDEIDPQAPNYIPITIFNSDGEEVEACGNGSRCVAKLICDEKKIYERE